MRINTNISAMFAYRQYNTINNLLAKSLERLSSGYRINRAGDDPAGLAISEKMRAQIRGLNMASRNSQDAISMIQTAEGALQSTHNILQRMRELAVQASSDTNEKYIDRGALQAEYEQLRNELNDIAHTTVFNDQKLLDGTFQKYKSTLASSSLKDVNSVSVTNALGGTYGMTIATIPAIPAKSTEGRAASLVTSKSTAISGTYSGAALKGISVEFQGIDTDAHNGNQYTIRVTGTEASNMTFQLIDSNNNLVATASQVNATTWGTNNATAITFSGVGTLKITLGTANGGKTIDADDLAGFNGKTLTFDESGKNKVTSAAQRARMDITINGETVSLYKGDTSAYFKESGIAFSFKALSDADIVNKNRFGASPSITVNQGRGSDFIVQTGANQGDELCININSMSASSLGVTFTDITRRDSASNAISYLDAAINKVSSQRAQLGAMSNRLEYKIQNLDNAAENLQAAESRIRDVDFAREMTEFARLSIMSQFATAMLAQANALAQNILSLLR